MSSRSTMYLIGATLPNIPSGKLPTNEDVLRNLYYYTKDCQMNLIHGLTAVINTVLTLWNEAGLRTRLDFHCQKQSKDLRIEYQEIQKRKDRDSCVDMIDKFSKKMKMKFDISHKGVSRTLYKQHYQLRSGGPIQESVSPPMEGTDPNASQDEDAVAIPLEADTIIDIDNTARDEIEIVSSDSDTASHYNFRSRTECVDYTGRLNQVASSQTSSEASQDPNQHLSQLSNSSKFAGSGRNYVKQGLRGTTNVMTDVLAIAFDYAKVSYRNSVRIIAAVAESFGAKITDLILNRETFRVLRNNVREKKSENIKRIFGEHKLRAPILHFRLLRLSWLMREVMQDWLKAKTPWEQSVMKKQAGRARIFTISGYFMILSCLMNFSVFPYFGFTVRLINNITDLGLEDGRFLPLQTSFPFDATSFPVFELLYISTIIAMLCNAIAFTFPDNLFGALVFHASAQAEIIGLQMRQIFDGFQGSQVECESLFRMRLKQIVTSQVRLTRLMRITEKSFKMIILSQVIGLSVATCSFGFGTIDALSNEGDHMVLARLSVGAVATLSLMFQILIYCIASEVFAHHIEMCSDYLYSSLWYTVPAQYSRDILIPMAISQVPLRPSVGGCVELSLNLYLRVCKSTYSYISVLLALRG